MTPVISIAVLAYHGDVSEHIDALHKSSKELKLPIRIMSVRSKEDIKGINGLILPGGESTTLQKLIEREGFWEELKKIPNIFGTCAGAILLAKNVKSKAEDQKTLELMDIEADRNAYGTQNESFEKDIETDIGRIHAVFIRAPKINVVGKNVKILAKDKDDILAVDQRKKGNYYLATAFHPELTTSLFHEYFLKACLKRISS